MERLNYFDAADLPAIRRDYPLGPEFLRRFRGMSRDELRSIQNRRFLEVMAFAWKVPFYQRLWGKAGIVPGDVRGIDDIARLPAYSKSDLMDSVDRYPPIGDFHGLDAHPADRRPPLVFQTTSGTTGKPQPLLFGPRSREIQNILLARNYLLQGMRPTDVVHSVYGFGMVNGGHYIRETIVHWVGAQLLSAGTGVETRSAQQVALMRDFGATVLTGFGDFVKRLADIARENGIEPGRDIRLRMITGHLGPEGRDPMSQAWGGCDVYDWYGVGDTGIIAGEGPDQSGMYVMEDAQYLELVHPDTGALVGPEEPGDMVCTCLFKDDVFPIIRFNTHDVTEEVTGDSPLGLPFRRILGFRGRSDNMVKLRGINVYPTGIGSLLATERPEFTGEYVCEVGRSGSREEMTVRAEVRGDIDDALRQAYEALLRARLGVEIKVVLELPGGLAELTGIETRQKPIRLIDRRKP
ncbi:phenylacetate--CoA ligase family protein [Vineibacter terrae]|uniref:Phenylacetate--CoA ligase n=1 Tax=Vineibacter terrae TaxID=2586908 RepID=A0A5C8PNT7_9HYPH|nr:AMP-binding protein [Vineibacter terrae]TXL76420.1 phenylacetate--CoA ligase [Vineibacter terrae]HEX2891976.1 AMP-binding protein [Vineibacter terrae]